MAIYRSGDDRLILHAVAPTEEDWNKSGAAPIQAKWLEYMAKLLETSEEGEIIFESLTEAFSFGMFKGD